MEVDLDAERTRYRRDERERRNERRARQVLPGRWDASPKALRKAIAQMWPNCTAERTKKIVDAAVELQCDSDNRTRRIDPEAKVSRKKTQKIPDGVIQKCRGFAANRIRNDPDVSCSEVYRSATQGFDDVHMSDETFRNRVWRPAKKQVAAETGGPAADKGGPVSRETPEPVETQSEGAGAGAAPEAPVRPVDRAGSAPDGESEGAEHLRIAGAAGHFSAVRKNGQWRVLLDIDLPWDVVDRIAVAVYHELMPDSNETNENGGSHDPA